STLPLAVEATTRAKRLAAADVDCGLHATGRWRPQSCAPGGRHALHATRSPSMVGRHLPGAAGGWCAHLLVRLCRGNRELRGQSNVLRAATFVALSYMGRLIIIIERGRDIMRELAGRTAFVTGAASGIGLALGRAFAEAGMNVMLADIEIDALATAVKSLDSFGRV